MKKLLFPIVLIFFGTNGLTQDIHYKDYDWEASPSYEKVSLQKEEHEVILLDKRVVEYGFEDDNFLEYNLRHKIIYVGSEKGLQSNNRIYVPADNMQGMMVQKARVMTSSGKIMELREEDIMEAKDEATNREYKYFALEGLDVGSYIEHFYLLKKYPDYSGTAEILQSEVRKKKVSFELISPGHLYFATKSYNGLPEIETDTSVIEKNYLKIIMEEIPALKEEPVSASMANSMMLVYKLDRNSANGKKDLTSYGDASKFIYQAIYAEQDKKTVKKLKNLLKESGAKSANSQEEQIRKIENYLKANIGLINSNHPDLKKPEFILEKKVAGHQGIVALYGHLFNELDIAHQVVLTTDRSAIKFDPDFESYNFLSKYLIYFPESNQYLAPTDEMLRYGFIPAELSHNYGLFIKPIEIGDLSTGVGKVKFIPALGHKKSTSDLTITVDFSDLYEPDINVINSMSGYYAQNLQPVYSYLPDDLKKEYVEGYVKYISGESEIRNMLVENENPEDFGIKPFVVKADFKTGMFTEKAGNKYLFKVGALIGEQVEMYTEDKVDRVLEVESDFNRKYHRKIKLMLPENYQITNLDDLNIRIADKEQDPTMAFISSYELNGNELLINVEEYYTRIIYPVEQFEQYLAVINAAADFNKLVLFMEEKD